MKTFDIVIDESYPTGDTIGFGDYSAYTIDTFKGYYGLTDADLLNSSETINDFPFLTFTAQTSASA